MKRLFLFLISAALIYFGIDTISEHLANDPMAGFGDKEYVIGAVSVAAGLLNFLNIIDG